MSEPADNLSGSANSTFRIVVHSSPSIDTSVTHWTEAPECPAAHEGGKSKEEAVERTKDRIRLWWTRLNPSLLDAGLRFDVDDVEEAH